MTETKPSSKLIQEWTWSLNVGIYDNCTATVRLYEDRAIVRMPGIKWQGNTGAYHLYRSLIDSSNRTDAEMLAQLLRIAANEAQDDEDYTEEVKKAFYL